MTIFHSMIVFTHTRNKQKDSLEDSLNRVSFTVELEFSKILPRLPPNISNVNNEFAG